jgi:thioredoxin-dependent peroxiredoxin
MLNTAFRGLKIKVVTFGILMALISAFAIADSTAADMPSMKKSSLLKVDKAGLKGEWVGKNAVDFRAIDQHKKWHSLGDYKGRWVVIYFYPADDSPGCTEEAKQFRDLYPAYQKRNIAILGVSLNDVKSHKAFADKLGLKFPLLADTNHQLAKSFKVLGGFGILPYAKRQTFLIDPQGVIVYHYSSVDTESHAAQVLTVKRQF